MDKIKKHRLSQDIKNIINKCSKKWKLIKVKELDNINSYELNEFDLLKLKQEILKYLEE